MKYYICLLLLIISTSCIKKAKDINEQNTIQVAQAEYLNSDFHLYPIVFDSLSPSLKDKYLNSLKNDLDPMVLRYYNKYRLISDMDTIFEILHYCSFDSLPNKNIVPLNRYILSEIEKNKHCDGYIGEFITDQHYYFFMRFPGYFYQYLNYLKNKGDSNEIKSILYTTFRCAVAMYDLKIEDLHKIFNNHRANIKDFGNMVNLTESFIMDNFKQIEEENQPVIIHEGKGKDNKVFRDRAF